MAKLPLVLLFLFFFAWPASAENITPGECVGQIQKSIDEADGEAFQRLVNLDGILDDALLVFVEQISNPGNATGAPPLLALLLSKGSGDKARQMLAGEVKAFALNGINSGAFAGKNLDAFERQGILAPLFANASTGRKTITGISDVKPDGNGWLVNLSLEDGGNGNVYQVLARLNIDGSTCRLEKVENLKELVFRILEEANQ